MKLAEIIRDIDVTSITGSLEAEVAGLCMDSRKLNPGDMFIALKGAGFDGTAFITDAIKAGASAILMQGMGPAPVGDVPYVLVSDARGALARISGTFYDNPSHELDVLGVTGTNGKTTTAHLVRSMLKAAGHSVGMIGTISYIIGEEVTPAPFTTPEAPDFQGLLRKMLDSGCGYVVSEVSSHALAQMRVDGTRFRVGVFTNLTQDHLDFHKDMDTYFAAKRRLFEELLDGASVVNVDDPYGARLVSMLKGNVLTFGVETEADVMAKDIDNTMEGVSFSLVTEQGSIRIESPLVGMPNVYNMLSAAGACLALGISAEHIAEGLRDMEPVEGRFQRVEGGQDFLCIVDYAHTDDALSRLIRTVREFTRGRVLTLFGCGGDRDKTKRPIMGKIATGLSDYSVITSDNPRGEDSMSIIDDILGGVVGDAYDVIPDRAEAIEKIISMAKSGDTVIIAGKGHETYQEISGVRHEFSDMDKALSSIAGLSAARGRS